MCGQGDLTHTRIFLSIIRSNYQLPHCKLVNTVIPNKHSYFLDLILDKCVCVCVDLCMPQHKCRAQKTSLNVVLSFHLLPKNQGSSVDFSLWVADELTLEPPRFSVSSSHGTTGRLGLQHRASVGRHRFGGSAPSPHTCAASTFPI